MEGGNIDADMEQVLLQTRDEHEDDGLIKLSFSEELRELSVLSAPVALSTLCRLLIINTDTAFVGNLGKDKLAASSFANTWNQFLSNVVYSPGYALNSLCSQAIGAKNFKLAGVWLQLALFVTSLIALPVLAGYLLTKPVVNLMVDDEARANNIPGMAQRFNVVSMLILFPMVLYMIIRQYFQAMQIVLPAMIVSGLTVAFNYLMNYVFVPEDGIVGWGLEGSPFATFLSMLFQLGCFVFWCVTLKQYHKPYWGGFTWEFLEPTRIRRFFKMVFPMAIGIVMENSGLQLITFSTGHIGTDNIAAHAILSSLWGILWAFYWGCGLALQVRVGSYLGKGNVHGARLVTKISMFLVVVICTVVGIGAWALRNPIAKLFTKDGAVIAIVEDSMYALCLDYFTACMALCAVNLLEAMAQNRILAFALSFGMWGVQVPCSLLFAYKVPYFADNGKQVQGIWFGQVCGEIFKIILLWGYIARLDWVKMCREAKERSEAAPAVDEGDVRLEHQLEEEDIHFAEEVRQIESNRRLNSFASGEMADTMACGSPSPFIGTRSPKFVRHIE